LGLHGSTSLLLLPLLLPRLCLQDWDATTTDWFTNKDEEDTPLPEYKLVFLWMDKNIAVGVDQVGRAITTFKCRLCVYLCMQPLRRGCGCV
jgi:hypothetical protein